MSKYLPQLPQFQPFSVKSRVEIYIGKVMENGKNPGNCGRKGCDA